MNKFMARLTVEFSLRLKTKSQVGSRGFSWVFQIIEATMMAIFLWTALSARILVFFCWFSSSLSSISDVHLQSPAIFNFVNLSQLGNWWISASTRFLFTEQGSLKVHTFCRYARRKPCVYIGVIQGVVQGVVWTCWRCQKLGLLSLKILWWIVFRYY